ncbi:MAG: hypothetical protein JWL97_3880 [Gemmatimonadales bacterium]|nr:hypothetical protein [Gemmatimonadales bacterium]
MDHLRKPPSKMIDSGACPTSLPTGRSTLRRSMIGITGVMLAITAACGRPPASPLTSRVIIGVTATSNEPGRSLTNNERKALRAAIDTDSGSAELHLGGSDPPTPVDLRLRRGVETEHDPDRRAQMSAQRQNAINTKLGQANGTNGRLDLLGVISEISRQPGPATIYLHSSGLNTTDPLDLRKIDWDTDPSAVVRNLTKQGFIPDLHGKILYFAGLGDTTGRQPSLAPPLRNKIITLWMKICQASGAKCRVDTEPTTGRSVSTTPVPVVAVESFPTIPMPRSGHKAVIQLPATLLFGPDSAVLLPGAADQLRPLARLLAAGDTATLVGHTATWSTPEGARKFSLARAQAVARSLIALGAPARSITSITGVGFDQQLVPDRDTAGHLIPEPASRNRRVEVTITAP